MNPETTVNLGNLLLSLSDAMDLASPLIASHQQRTAFIAWEISKTAKLPEETIELFFVSALMHDMGALTPEEKIDIHQFEEVNTETHCIRGKFFLESLNWLAPAGEIVRHHHHDWKELDGKISDQTILGAQIIHLADYLERKIDRNTYILHQHEGLIKDIRSLSTDKIHPNVVKYFEETSHREEFWLDLATPRLYSLLLHNGPYKRLEVDLASITKIAELFRDIIDFRSRFTATHSSGVAECSAAIARLFGFTPSEVKLIEVAGNFHDIGKLVVPNSILNKLGKLTEKDKAVIRQHSYHTFSILNTIGGLRHLAEWSSFHHEKLDGTGYPFHHKAEKISTQSRIIIVADMFTAMSEDRPYRPGMDKDKLLSVLQQQADNQLLDSQIVDILVNNHQDILHQVQSKQKITQEYYDQKFAPLVNTQ